MPPELSAVQRAYRWLLGLYPRAFRERLGESLGQTFDDLYRERLRQPEQGLTGFVLGMFLDTALGIVKEHLALFSRGELMRSLPKTFGFAALLSALLVLPFIVMEFVNRRAYNEDFPFMLFAVLWLNLLAIGLIVLPVVAGWWSGQRGSAAAAATPGSTVLAKPRQALLLSLGLILAPMLLLLLDTLGLVPLNRLVNGPDPSQPYPFGAFISLASISIPIAAGMIAAAPVASTLRAGGSLLAHPLHLLLVVGLVVLFASGVANLLIDQMPCFLGVPMCD